MSALSNHKFTGDLVFKFDRPALAPNLPPPTCLLPALPPLRSYGKGVVPTHASLHPQLGRFVLLGVAARVPEREGVAGLLCDLVCVPLPVLARVWLGVPVA